MCLRTCNRIVLRRRGGGQHRRPTVGAGIPSRRCGTTSCRASLRAVTSTKVATPKWCKAGGNLPGKTVGKTPGKPVDGYSLVTAWWCSTYAAEGKPNPGMRMVDNMSGSDAATKTAPHSSASNGSARTPAPPIPRSPARSRRRPAVIGAGIERSDLVVVDVRPNPLLDVVAADQFSSVVGASAATSLLPGSLLTPRATTDKLMPGKGMSLVGVVLTITQLPADRSWQAIRCGWSTPRHLSPVLRSTTQKRSAAKWCRSPVRTTLARRR